MKTHIILNAAFLTLFFVSSVAGVDIYTWTDEKGVIHMTNEPPPKNVKVDKVTPYNVKQEGKEHRVEREISQEQENLRWRKQREAEAARLKARRAEKEAQAAIQRSNEVYQQSSETIEIYANKNKSKRKQYRKKIQKAKDEAEAARAEAEAAIERSKQAAKAAQIAEKEAAAVDDGD